MRRNDESQPPVPPRIHEMNNADLFRERIRSGKICVGTAITFSDPAVSELVAEAGYDFTWIDMEHAPLDLPHSRPRDGAARDRDGSIRPRAIERCERDQARARSRARSDHHPRS